MLPDTALVLAAVGLGALHLRGARHEREAAGGGRHRGRDGAWMFPAGLVLVLLALSPAVEAAADRSFAWHMAQHQVLVLLAAPLLAASAPLRRLWLGASGGGRPLPVLRTDPGVPVLLAGAGAMAVMLAWHVPAAYDAALGDQGVHVFEHATLLLSAVLLWAAVSRAAADDRRLGHAVVTLAGSAIVGAGLGVLLLTAPQPLYGWYAAGGSLALEQQRVGGALMKVGALLVYAGAAVGLTLRWLHRLEASASTPVAR
ncbi:cytochrome c oxidase assembly protein [Egicoccus sp. AB-alg6-2]|uniref:cytochrome c oxidase assembly protein n=1 Tax=Egicoccus sp. AB-alg6-2 TaxID=3242692 RepID=UPI00359D243C